MTGLARSENEPTLRIGPLVNLAALVQSLGCDPEPIFENCGFRLEEFRDPDHRVSFIQASRLLKNCVGATKLEHLGLMLGQRTAPCSTGTCKKKRGGCIKCATSS